LLVSRVLYPSEMDVWRDRDPVAGHPFAAGGFGVLEWYGRSQATAAVWAIVDEANRCIDAVRPWELAKGGRESALDGVLGSLVVAGRVVAAELAPFLPDLAARVGAQCAEVDGRLPAPRPLVARL